MKVVNRRTSQRNKIPTVDANINGPEKVASKKRMCFRMEYALSAARHPNKVGLDGFGYSRYHH